MASPTTGSAPPQRRADGSDAPAAHGHEPSLRRTVGTLLSRAVAPLWIALGAGFKLSERTPMLLPTPVRSVINTVGGALGFTSEAAAHDFLEFSLRSIIAAEFILAAAMVFLPRVSRALAISVMTLFVVILAILLGSGEAKCGCFGKAGPSPSWMIVIDGAILLGLLFNPTARGKNLYLPWILVGVAGAGIAFGLPPVKVEVTVPDGSAPSASGAGAVPPGPGPTTPPQSTNPPQPVNPPVGEQPGATTPPVPPAGTTAAGWPPVPKSIKGYYVPKFPEWIGKKLSDQDMMLLLKRPIPAGIDSGKWNILFYRLDCDHCQELINKHFSGPLPAKTLLISVPDKSPGPPLPNVANAAAVKSELLRFPNGPDYLISTPVVITIVDGVVKSVCEDPSDSEEHLKATLDAK